MQGKLVFENESLEFYSVEEKTVTKAPGGKNQVVGKVYLPASWIGKKVKCLLLEEPDKKD